MRCEPNSRSPSPPDADRGTVDAKRFILFGATVGSIVGGALPGLWHASAFSWSGVVCTALGGFAGIWVTYKLTR